MSYDPGYIKEFVARREKVDVSAVTVEWLADGTITGAAVNGASVAVPTDAEIGASLAAERAAEEAIRKATPQIMDQPWEFPLVVLQSTASGYGVGITATDDDELVAFRVHSSPWPKAEAVEAARLAAVNAHNAHKAAAAVKADTLKASLKDNMSAKEMRAVVESLQAQIDAILGRLK